jgi:hypothetical protein
MTKPRNFPERVNRRRKDALRRMGDMPYPRREADIAALRAAITDNARDIKTKKYRGARQP